MKLFIILSVLMCIGSCFGQRYDSVHVFDMRTHTPTMAEIYAYIYADSAWTTDDYRYFHYKNFKKGTSHVFDSVTIYGNEEPVYHRKYDTVYDWPAYHRKKDTIPVILIVIDTSLGIKFLIFNTSPLGQAKIDGRIPFWIYGYSVRELHNYNEDVIVNGVMQYRWNTMQENGNNYWKHLYYLDSNKSPLNKNIVVWQSVEIK